MSISFFLLVISFKRQITDSDVLVHQPLAYYINVPFTELIHDETNFYLNTVIAPGEKNLSYNSQTMCD